MTRLAIGYYQKRGINPQTSIVFDRELFTQIARLASYNNISFSAQVRALTRAALKQLDHSLPCPPPPPTQPSPRSPANYPAAKPT